MIEIDGLTKRYGDKTAVDGLSFVVEPGVVTGFLGPNGAGKSTTPPRRLTTRKGCEDTGMSFWTPAGNPGTRPLRSRAFDIGCALVAALGAFGSFSFAQTAHPALPVLLVSLIVAVLTALVLPLRRVWLRARASGFLLKDTQPRHIPIGPPRTRRPPALNGRA